MQKIYKFNFQEYLNIIDGCVIGTISMIHYTNVFFPNNTKIYKLHSY